MLHVPYYIDLKNEESVDVCHQTVMRSGGNCDAELVEACALDCAQLVWWRLFDEYGTHFISTMYLGGKIVTEVCRSTSYILR